METNKITLITGGNGLVGSQFTKGEKVGSSKGADFRDRNIVETHFRVYKPDYVVHTAAKVGGIEGNMKAQAEFFYDNIMLNTNVIEACRKYEVERAAVFLSTCVFPNSVEYPLTEGKIHLGPSHFTNYGYAEAKRAASTMVRAYNEQYGTKYFCVIPCNVYGPNDNFDVKNGHVIPSLIRKCDLAKKGNNVFEIWGDGIALREFIYSKDLARITEELLYETDFVGDVIVSNTKEYSIKHVVDTIVDLMDFRGEVKWDTDKPNGQYRKPSSIEKLEYVLKAKQTFVPLEEGLKETIDWYYKNYDAIRI